MTNVPATPSSPRTPEWRKLWSVPDPSFVDAGQRGEWLLAIFRILLVLLLLYYPLDLYLHSSQLHARHLLWLGVGALAEALVVYSAVRRSWGRRWMGFFSGFLDVTLVSAALATLYRLGGELYDDADLLLFPLYLLAIGATALRYDYRISVLSGLGAVVQYLLLASYAETPRELVVGRGGLLIAATVLAAAVVVRAREHRHLSTRDRLTDLANRGYFDESLGNLGAIAARSGEPVTVMILDIDHFKRFNDRFGHQAGDEALRTVARIFAHSFRLGDVCARYGGEELAGIFPGLAADDAYRRMERLRVTIARHPVTVDQHHSKTHVTVSVGVAVWPQDGPTLEDVLRAADRRLYLAKELGRDRVVASDGEGTVAEPADRPSPTSVTPSV